MSVEVEGLSKVFGEQPVLESISFKAKPGEVLGFLGPNGAGKSTTMRIITSFLPATSGLVSVCGFDVGQQAMEVKSNVGYLAENNPLYTDMFIPEFLKFSARIHNLKKPNSRIEDIIGLTGLTGERHKKIAHLSKGYRQRVGLAQALLHNPPVLILDEPTSGLDPNQLTGIRALIKELGKEKTVILSTHIMQEVQAICDRVVIINKGKIVADDTTAALQGGGSKQFIFSVEFQENVSLELFDSLKEIIKANQQPDSKWLVVAKTDIREKLFKIAVERNLTIIGLNLEKQSLEEVFRQLTQETGRI